MGLGVNACSCVSIIPTAELNAALSIWNGLAKLGTARTGWLHSAVYRECIAELSVSIQYQVASLQSRA